MSVHERQFEENRAMLESLLARSSYISAYKDIPKTISTYKDWTDIPVLRKKSLQQDWESFMTNPELIQNPSMYISKTSGSTGQPVMVLRTLQLERLLTKQLWALRKQWSPDIMKWRLLYLYRNIESRSLNILRIGEHEDYLDLSNASLSNYVTEITDFTPQWLIGPPIAAARLAQFFRDHSLSAPQMQLAELYGEMIQPHQRKTIEDTFGCKTINHYGAREFGVLSYECPHGHMHAWTNHYFFEVLRDGIPVNPGEEGELVVTSLTNTAMPLIRYAIGDYVKVSCVEHCSCGNQHYLCIEPVGARISSLVYTKTKIVSSGIFDIHLSRFIRNHPEFILEYQVIQHSLQEIEIKLVTGGHFHSSRLNKLMDQIKEHVDVDQLYATVVEQIETSKSGKTPIFISKIRQ